jgi:hypothetical protein
VILGCNIVAAFASSRMDARGRQVRLSPQQTPPAAIRRGQVAKIVCLQIWAIIGVLAFIVARRHDLLRL